MARFGAMPNFTGYNPQQGPYNPPNVLGYKAGLGNQISTAPAPVLNRYGAFQKNMEKWLPYLGFPSKPIIMDPYDDYSRENFDLPEAYFNTQNFSVSLLLINRIMAADAYHVTEMLPWKIWEGGDTIMWDEWRFEDHMLTRTPEESVSRLLTSTFAQNKEYIVRYGIAVILEHGFWNTPKGQTSFDMQLLQIENASIETACHSAQLAVLNPDWTKMPGYMQVGVLKGSADTEARIRHEVNNFGILHKETNGHLIVLSQAREIMKLRNGRTGNFVQWPSGALKHVMLRPDQTLALYSGRGGYKEEPITSGSTVAGEKHYESRALRIGERQAPVDPSFREVVIGGYAQLDVPHLKHIPPEQFSYDKAMIKIYSEDADKIVPIPYQHFLKMTGAFYMPEGNIDTSYDADWKMSSIGKQWFGGCQSWAEYEQAHNNLDHFLRGIAALSDERFMSFLDWFVKRAQNAGKLSAGEKKQLQDQKGASYGIGGAWQPGGTLVAASLLDEDAEDHEIDKDARGLFGMAKEYKSLADFQAAVQSLRTPFADQLLCYVTVLARAYPQLSMRFGNAAPAGIEALRITARYVDDDDKSLATSIVATVQNCLRSEAHKSFDWAALPANTTQAVVVAEAAIREMAYVLNDKTVLTVTGHGNAAVGAAGTVDFAQPPVADDQMRQIFRVASMYAATLQGVIPMLVYPTAAADAQIFASATGVWLSAMSHAAVNAGTANTQIALLYLVTVLNSRFAFWAAQANDAAKAAAVTAMTTQMNTPNSAEWNRIPIANLANELKKPHILPAYQWHLLPVLEAWKSLIQASIANGVVAGQPITHRNVTDQQLTEAFNKILPSKFYLVSKTPSLGVASRMALLEKKRREHVRTLPGTSAATRESLLAMWNPAVMERYRPVFDAIEVLYRNLPGACEALFRRRVLTFLLPESNPIARSVLQNSEQEPMTPTQFIYFMSLVETIWEDEWKTAASDDQKQSSLDKVALIMEEMYLSHNITDPYVRNHPGSQPDLFRVLFANYRDVWEPQSQSVDEFLRKANAGGNANSLRNTIVETQKSLLLRVRSLGSRYFSQLERQMPPGVRRRLQDNEHESKSASRLLVRDSLDIRGIREAMTEDSDYTSAPGFGTTVVLSGQHPGNAAGPMSLGGRISTLADEMKDMRRMFGSERLAAVLRQQPLTSKLLRFALIHNLPPLLGLGLVRPHEIYVMGTVVYMIAGGEAGWTFRGHENFMLQNDAMRKLIFGHFTMYLKSLVMRPEYIVHIENVYGKEYVGGCGHDFWDPLDKFDRQAYFEGEMVHSCFAFPMHPNERIEKPTIDITGRMHPDLPGAADENGKGPHYSAAPLLSHLWRWTHPTQSPLESRGFGPNASIRYNTLCREMLQFKWQHKGSGGGGYDDITINQGHWGPRTYAGCAKVRSGQSMYLEPVPYSGTSTMAIIT